MFESWMERLAIRLKQANPEETASVPVLKFGLILLFNLLLPIIVSLILGAATGVFAGTALAIVLFSALRMASGGYHFDSPIPCMAAMIVITVLPPHLSLTDGWTLGLTAGSLALVALLAPSNMRGYYRLPEKYYPLLKLLSVLIVSANFWLQSPIAALVFAVQAISLLFHNKTA